MKIEHFLAGIAFGYTVSLLIILFADKFRRK